MLFIWPYNAHLGQLRRRWVDGIGPKSLVRVADKPSKWIASGSPTILAQVKQTISKRVGCRQLVESSAKLLGSFAADYLPFGTFCRSSCKEFCRNTAGPGVSVLRQGASEDREDYIVLRAQHKYPYNGGYPMITPHAHVSRSIGNQEMEAKPLLHSQPGLHVAAPGWNGKIRPRAARLACGRDSG
jgi:hypothetical protein